MFRDKTVLRNLTMIDSVRDMAVEHLRKRTDELGMEQLVTSWNDLNQRAQRALPMRKAYAAVRSARDQEHRALIDLANDTEDASFGNRFAAILEEGQRGVAQLLAHAWVRSRCPTNSIDELAQHLVTLPPEFLLVELVEMNGYTTSSPWTLAADIELLGRFLRGVHIENSTILACFDGGILAGGSSSMSQKACVERHTQLLRLARSKSLALAHLFDPCLWTFHRALVKQLVTRLGAICHSRSRVQAREALIDHVLRQTKVRHDARGAAPPDQPLPPWAEHFTHLSLNSGAAIALIDEFASRTDLDKKLRRLVQLASYNCKAWFYAGVPLKIHSRDVKIISKCRRSDDPAALAGVHLLRSCPRHRAVHFIEEDALKQKIEESLVGARTEAEAQADVEDQAMLDDADEESCVIDLDEDTICDNAPTDCDSHHNTIRPSKAPRRSPRGTLGEVANAMSGKQLSETCFSFLKKKLKELRRAQDPGDQRGAHTLSPTSPRNVEFSFHIPGCCNHRRRGVMAFKKGPGRPRMPPFVHCVTRPRDIFGPHEADIMRRLPRKKWKNRKNISALIESANATPHAVEKDVGPTIQGGGKPQVMSGEIHSMMPLVMSALLLQAPWDWAVRLPGALDSFHHDEDSHRLRPR